MAQTEHHDTEVFSLSTLLCSVLIFNGTRTIDETSIQTLGFIANLTERIRVKSNQAKAAGEGVSDGIVEEADLSRFFPSFVWVLRDFALMLHDEVRICLCPSSRGSSFSATAVVRLC